MFNGKAEKLSHIKTNNEVLVSICKFKKEGEGPLNDNLIMYHAIVAPCQDSPDLPSKFLISFFNDDGIKIKNNLVVRFLYNGIIKMGYDSAAMFRYESLTNVGGVGNLGIIESLTAIEIFQIRKHLFNKGKSCLT